VLCGTIHLRPFRGGRVVITCSTLQDLTSHCLSLVIYPQTTEDCFNMDYRYPLSLLQAFAICIARYVLTP
jgi:hypothetical protein